MYSHKIKFDNSTETSNSIFYKIKNFFNKNIKTAKILTLPDALWLNRSLLIFLIVCIFCIIFFEFLSHLLFLNHYAITVDFVLSKLLQLSYCVLFFIGYLLYCPSKLFCHLMKHLIAPMFFYSGIPIWHHLKINVIDLCFYGFN